MTPDLLQDHPSRHQLRQLSLGLSQTDAMSAIEQHVLDCPVCWKTLKEIPQSDPFIDILRDGATQKSSAHTAPSLSPSAHLLTIDHRGASRRTPAPELSDRHIGDHVLLEEIARGGMGVVYKARQLSLNRLVAVKMILAGQLASEAEVQRFHTEAEAAATLDHPNIVPIYEVGRHKGQHYFSMKLIEGGSLSRQVSGLQQHPRSAARILAAVARAVHHAHQRGILHRDLKPSNILLSGRTGEWEPHVTDFGLARRVEQDSGLTQTGVIVGTAAYMAPGQVLGQKQLSTAADVYSLGAILYELLTNQPPFRGATTLDILRQVAEREPERPRRLNPRAPRDLETVCLKCLDKDPHRRYSSAEALAEDLERYLAHEPIQARPSTVWERSLKWVRRRPGMAALLACVVVLLCGGSVVSTWFGLDAREQSRQANKARDASQTAEGIAKEKKRLADLHAAELTFRLALQQAEAGAVDRGLFLMLRAWRQAPQDAVGLRTAIRANLAGWSRQLPRLRQAIRVEKSPEQTGRMIRVGDPRGRTFLTSFRSGGIRCFDTITGRPAPMVLQRAGLQPPLLSGKWFNGASANGRWLSVIHGETMSLFDRATGTTFPRPWPQSGMRGTAFHDHDLVATLDQGKQVFWDLRTGKELPARLQLGKADSYLVARTDAGQVVALVFRGGETSARQQLMPLIEPGFAARNLRVEAIDLGTGKAIDRPVPLAGGSNPSITYDGRVALTDLGSSVMMWDLTTGQSQGILWRSRRQAAFNNVSRDGLEAFSGGMDLYLRQYDLATGLQRGGDLLCEPQTESWGKGVQMWWDVNPGMVTDWQATATADDRLLCTLSQSGVARVWDTSLCRLQLTLTANPRGRQAGAVSGKSQVRRADYSGDGRRVVLTWRGQDYALLLDARTGDLLGPPLRQPFVEHAVFSRDGHYLATAPFQGLDGRPPIPIVILRDGHTGKPIAEPWLSPKLIHALAFSPDSKTLAVAGVGGTFILDVPGNTLRHVLPETTCIRDVQFHPDSRRLVALARRGWEGVGAGLRVWDVWSGKALGPFRPCAAGMGPVAAWAADEAGRFAEPATSPGELMSCEFGKTGLVRLSPDGKTVRRGFRPTGPIHLVRFSPDGKRMVAGTSASNMQQWDTRTGERIGGPLTHPEPTQVVRYSPDGKLLAVACEGDSVRLQDADTGWPLGPPLMHAGMPIQLVFSDNNRTLLSITEAGIVYTWPVPHPVEDDSDRFEAWMKAKGGLRLEGEEAVQVSPEEWQEACRTLQERWPVPDLALSEVSDDLAGWHRQRTLDAEGTGNDRGELYHLARLVALRPGEPALHARIARVHARVAGRLPAGPQRERQWQLAWAAAKRGMGWPGQDNWTRVGFLEARARQSWDEALWYLDRLSAHGDWSVFAERADVHGQRGDRASRDADLRRALTKGGNKQRDFVVKVAEVWAREDRWQEATPLLIQALEIGPPDASLLPRLALAQLKAGSRNDHAMLCRALLGGLRASAKRQAGGVAMVARVCALSPVALEDWELALALMKEAIALLEKSVDSASGQEKEALQGLRREWLTTQAALMHRAGQHAGAIKRLNKAMKLAPGGEGGPVEWAWLALAHAATEPAPRKQARHWLARAKANAPKRADGLWEAVLVEVLVAEAMRALGDTMF